MIFWYYPLENRLSLRNRKIVSHECCHHPILWSVLEFVFVQRILLLDTSMTKSGSACLCRVFAFDIDCLSYSLEESFSHCSSAIFTGIVHLFHEDYFPFLRFYFDCVSVVHKNLIFHSARQMLFNVFAQSCHFAARFFDLLDCFRQLSFLRFDEFATEKQQIFDLSPVGRSTYA